jgi:hypothetical protein
MYVEIKKRARMERRMRAFRFISKIFDNFTLFKPPFSLSTQESH